MPGNCHFRDAWLENVVYKEWILKVSSKPDTARCKFCLSNFNVSNMGEAALKSHMKSEKHKQAKTRSGMYRTHMNFETRPNAKVCRMLG